MENLWFLVTYWNMGIILIQCPDRVLLCYSWTHKKIKILMFLNTGRHFFFCLSPVCEILKLFSHSASESGRCPGASWRSYLKGWAYERDLCHHSLFESDRMLLIARDIFRSVGKLKIPLRNFHFVLIVAVPVDKSGTAFCCKDLV